MSDFDLSLLKAHFGQLVDAVGTQDAAAAFLGVSRQRVGQLISIANSDAPTWAQVWKLEKVTGQSLVFAAFGRMTAGEEVSAGALAAAVESTATATRALQTVHAAKADGHLDAREVESVRDAARENLEAAQRQYDESMRLRPTLRVVA